MTSARTKAYLLLLIATLIWGIAGPVIKFTLGGISPLLFLVYRFGISSLIAVIFFSKLTFRFPRDKKTLIYLFISTTFQTTIGLSLLFFGLKNTTVLDMTLITLMAPLLAAESGVRFLHERITTREKIGMGVALLGTLFTVIEPLAVGGGDGIRTSGNALILLYLVSTVVPAILTKKLLRAGVKAVTLTNLEFLTGFITLLPFALLTYGYSETTNTLSGLDLKYHLGILFMALFSGSLAYTLFNKAQKTIEVGEAAVFSYLYPLFAAPLAVLWLKEKVTSRFIIGAMIIAIGVVIAEYKKTKLSKVQEKTL